MTPWGWGAAFALGAVLGSFLNVCIHRLPREESLVWPGSRCPDCQAPIRPWDNIPLVSFVILRGRCRACGTGIPWRYPAVEGLAGVLLALTLHRFGWHARTAALVIFVLALVVVTFVDLEHQIIPHAVTLPGIPLGLVASLLPGRPQPTEALVGALAGAGFLYLVAVYGDALLKKESMGGGDVNLAAMMGAFLGWRLLAVACFLACLAGSVVGGSLLLLKVKSREEPIPFGPFLALGGLLALFEGEPLINWYWGLWR